MQRQHGPSGATLETDAPVDNQGKGESFSPTDLVGTALGSCMATIMGIYAQQKGIPLEGMRIEVSKEMTQDRAAQDRPADDGNRDARRAGAQSRARAGGADVPGSSTRSTRMSRSRSISTGRIESWHVERGYSDFGEKLSAHSGIYDVMEDLGQALSAGGMIMMGGGNPAHVPAVEKVWRRRLEEILATPGAMESMLGDYDTPRGRPDFLETLAAFFKARLGWPVGPENIAVTTGSQTANFLLFNLLAGPARGGREMRRILFPLVPEYIGYADQGIAPDMFRAWRPEIELRGSDRFKYRLVFGEMTPDIAALCVSRPTNPSSNVITDAELSALSRLAGGKRRAAHHRSRLRRAVPGGDFHRGQAAGLGGACDPHVFALEAGAADHAHRASSSRRRGSSTGSPG